MEQIVHASRCMHGANIEQFNGILGVGLFVVAELTGGVLHRKLRLWPFPRNQLARIDAAIAQNLAGIRAVRPNPSNVGLVKLFDELFVLPALPPSQRLSPVAKQHNARNCVASSPANHGGAGRTDDEVGRAIVCDGPDTTALHMRIRSRRKRRLARGTKGPLSSTSGILNVTIFSALVRRSLSGHISKEAAFGRAELRPKRKGGLCRSFYRQSAANEANA